MPIKKQTLKLINQDVSMNYHNNTSPNNNMHYSNNLDDVLHEIKNLSKYFFLRLLIL
ncbi:hypothetical protein C4A39_03582 [Escherichia coli]|nr:hypothetical protein C4A39_03582 [Escherichia coli]RDQ59654.1 hypothetical protein C4A28_03556 [Escherichia coli]